MGAGQSTSGSEGPLMSAAASQLGPETLADIHHLVEAKVFTVEKICHYYKVFMSQHPTGKLTKDEFIQLYLRCFPDGNKATEFAEHLFDVFDADHDQNLDFREIMLLCGLLWEKSHEGQIEWSFKIFDVDGDGFITKSECREIEKMWFKQSGRLKNSEVNARAHEAVYLIFKEYDNDHDGKISKEEFLNAVKKEHKGYYHMEFDDRYIYDLMNLLGGNRINPLDKMDELAADHKTEDTNKPDNEANVAED